MSLPFPSEEDLKPVRFIASREHSFELVERWNRMHASHSVQDAARMENLSSR